MVINANEILPNLWIGSEPYLPAEVYKDFDTIVFSAKGIDVRPYFKKFSDKKILQTALEDRLYLPEGTFIKAEQMAYWVADEVFAGRKVLVTCAAGLNRSGLITALALRLITGKSGVECVKEVQEKRFGALNNETFAKYVSMLLPII